MYLVQLRFVACIPFYTILFYPTFGESKLYEAPRWLKSLFVSVGAMTFIALLFWIPVGIYRKSDAIFEISKIICGKLYEIW